MQAPSVPPVVAPQKRQSAPLSQPLAATLIAYWLSLLTTAGHSNNSHWPRCQESREDKKKRRGESKEKRKKGSWIRDRQRGKTCVFSFHYTGSLKRMGGGKKCPCQNRESLEVLGGVRVPSADTQLTNMEPLKIEQFMLENNGLWINNRAQESC